MSRLASRPLRNLLALSVGLSPFLAGCETVSGSIFPDAPSAPTASSTPATIVAAPQAGTSQFTPALVTPGASSGSPAGAAIETARNDLVRLQGKLSGRNVTLANVRQAWTQDVAAYRTQKNLVLRGTAGTDPKTALSQGDAVLTRLAGHSSKLNREMEGFAQGNADANALMRRLDVVSPANEADRDQLNRLRAEVLQTSSSLDGLINALSSEGAQNTAFLAKERASLVSLGLTTGPAPAIKAAGATTAVTPTTTTPIGPPRDATKPTTAPAKPAFVTIKFDRPSVTYRDALGAALKQALLRRPDAAFDVVGITASAAQDAQDLVKARAEDVSRTMMELGVSAAKIGIDSQRDRGTTSDEVRIFVR